MHTFKYKLYSNNDENRIRTKAKLIMFFSKHRNSYKMKAVNHKNMYIMKCFDYYNYETFARTEIIFKD